MKKSQTDYVVVNVFGGNKMEYSGSDNIVTVGAAFCNFFLNREKNWDVKEVPQFDSLDDIKIEGYPKENDTKMVHLLLVKKEKLKQLKELDKLLKDWNLVK